MPQQHAPVPCTKCKAITTEGAWFAGLGFDYNGALVAGVRALCASCAAEFADEEQRIAFVAEIESDLWTKVTADKEHADENRVALARHFTPCPHCGSDKVSPRFGGDKTDVRLRVVCKGCNTVHVDVKEPYGKDDMALRVLTQLRSSVGA